MNGFKVECVIEHGLMIVLNLKCNFVSLMQLHEYPQN